jgi:hypothetical protein
LDSYEKINHIGLPNYTHFNKCDKEKCMKKSHMKAQAIYNQFGCENFGEFLHVYMMVDIVLLADIFENYINLTIETYKLCPTHYYSAPGLFWDAALLYCGEQYEKDTGREFYLEQLTNQEIHMMFEAAVVGGVSSVMTQRGGVANNKYLPEFDINKPSSYFLYVDANNLYGSQDGMSGVLPMRDIELISPTFITPEWIKDYDFDSDKGYMIECDLEYPASIHDLHVDFPMAPQNIKPFDYEKEQGKYMKDLSKKLNTSPSKISKLCPNLSDKINYVCDGKNLQYYLSQGLILKKVHKAVQY